MPDRTTPFSHREVRTFLVGGCLLVALFLVVMYLWYWNNDTPGPIDEKYYIKAEKEEDWIKRLFGDPVALFTLILTGATLGLWLATRSLWVATEALVKDAREASERQLRAYVGIDDMEVFPMRDQNREPTRLRVTVKNFGNSPGKRYSIRINWLDEVIARDRLASGLPERQNSSTLMPSNRHLIFLPPPERHSGVSIVFGRIVYVDIFDQPRFTDFRFRSIMGTNRFTPDVHGNDSD